MNVLHTMLNPAADRNATSGDPIAQGANLNLQAGPDASFWRDVFQQIDAASRAATSTNTTDRSGTPAAHATQPAQQASEQTASTAQASLASTVHADSTHVKPENQRTWRAARSVINPPVPHPASGSIDGSFAASDDATDMHAMRSGQAHDALTDATRWSPVNATLAATADGHWKLYVRGAGIGLKQALDASRAALADKPGDPGRVIEITINGRVAYQDRHAASAQAEASAQTPTTRLNWSI